MPRRTDEAYDGLKLSGIETLQRCGPLTLKELCGNMKERIADVFAGEKNSTAIAKTARLLRSYFRNVYNTRVHESDGKYHYVPGGTEDLPTITTLTPIHLRYRTRTCTCTAEDVNILIQTRFPDMKKKSIYAGVHSRLRRNSNNQSRLYDMELTVAPEGCTTIPATEAFALLFRHGQE